MKVASLIFILLNTHLLIAQTKRINIPKTKVSIELPENFKSLGKGIYEADDEAFFL